MKRFAPVAVVLSLLTTPIFANKLERNLEERWRGAWVVSKVAVQSDCAGFHTDNDVNGTLVSSRGRWTFKPGELARIDKVDLKRSRVDLYLGLPEPVLVASLDGPFTLYGESRCLVELDVELPRSLVSADDVTGIEAALGRILERHASQEEAQSSRVWNQRKRDPVPPDYDRTLAAHAAWKAEQVNAGIQARIDRAFEETSRLTDRITSDKDYMAGFSAGVEAMRGIDLSQCGALMSRDFGSFGSAPQAAHAATGGGEAQQRFARGYQDGQKLIFGLESIRRLPSCFTHPRETPAVNRSSN
jgi:hypothetical protein